MNQQTKNYSVFIEADDAHSKDNSTLQVASLGSVEKPSAEAHILPSSKNSKAKARVICERCGFP